MSSSKSNMLAYSFLFGLIFFLITPVLSEEYYYHVRGCCVFRGAHFDDTEYTLTFGVDKTEMVVYNSTLGRYSGFTAFAIEAAKKMNHNPSSLFLRKTEKDLLCDNNIKYIQNIGNITSTPIVKIKSVKQSDGKHPATLVCSAYNFYPKQILVTWLRNGQKVTEGISTTDMMPDGEFFYQFHSYLSYTPTSGETITCMVEHVSLSEPKLVNWDNSLTLTVKLQIAVGLVGLVLGLIITGSGFIYYKKSAAFTLCKGHVLFPVQDLLDNRVL